MATGTEWNSPSLGELEKTKPPLLNPQNQRNQCLVILHAQRSVLKGVVVMQEMWGSLQTRMGSSQGVSDVLGWCPGTKRGTLGSLNANTGESLALPWGGARHCALFRGGAQSTNHSPKKQVSLLINLFYHLSMTKDSGAQQQAALATVHSLLSCSFV